jgi:para-nitrobenzyl esterase
MNFLKTTALLTAVNYAQEVNLANGVTLKGKTCGDADDQECYKGIPYAAAPIGDNRFRPPQDYSFESTSYDATDVGFSCNQPGKDPADGYGEDCLFLNVYTPATGEGKAD